MKNFQSITLTDTDDNSYNLAHKFVDREDLKISDEVLEFMEVKSSHIEAGMDVDDFAPRLSFFFNSHLDFFEEIAKFRAARRIWAKEMKRRYNPKIIHYLIFRNRNIEVYT